MLEKFKYLNIRILCSGNSRKECIPFLCMYSNHHDWGKRKAGKRGEELGESSPPPQSWTEFGDSLFLPLVIMSTMSPGTRNEHYNARAHTHTQAEAVLSVVRTAVHYYSKSFSLSPVCFNSLRKRREQRRGLPPPPSSPLFSPRPLAMPGKEGGRKGATWSGGGEGGGHDIKADGLCLGARCQVGGGKRRRSELPPPPPSTPPHFFLLPRHKEEVGSFPRDGRCFI